jgi:hypothetical protein
MEGVFAESADRVFFVQLGELPLLTRPPVTALPRVQKFRPRPGARPELLVGKPPASP